MRVVNTTMTSWTASTLVAFAGLTKEFDPQKAHLSKYQVGGADLPSYLMENDQGGTVGSDGRRIDFARYYDSLTVPRYHIWDADPCNIDQGGYYCLSFDVIAVGGIIQDGGGADKSCIALQTGTGPGDADEMIKISFGDYVSTVGWVLKLIDSNQTVLDFTGDMTNYDPVHVEVIWGTGSSDNWWWYINGTLEGSGTTGNFSNASPNYLWIGNQGSESSPGGYGNNFAIANVVFMSGLADNTERLGTGHFIRTHKYMGRPADSTGPGSGTGSNPTTGGDTPDQGTIDHALGDEGFTTPVKFNAPVTANKSCWANIDGVNHYTLNPTGLIVPTRTFTSSNGTWTNNSSLVDWDIGDFCTTTLTGDATTQFIQVSSPLGDPVPDWWFNLNILAVDLIITRGSQMTSSDYLGFVVRESWPSGELYLSTQSIQGTGTTVTSFYRLTEPAAGWSKTSFEAYQTRLWLDSGNAFAVSRVGARLWVQWDTPDDEATTDVRWITIDTLLGDG